MSEISNVASQSHDRVLAVDGELEDEFEEESPETDQTFELALWVITHTEDFELDPDAAGEKAEAMSQVGMKTAHFGGDNGRLWTIQVNWDQYKWSAKIPPGYCRVEYAGQDVGIIGPWLTIRTCWNCQARGWRTDLLPAKIGIVVPGQPCPHCGELDWYGVMVSPEMFIRDAAEFIANQSGDSDHIYRMMAGKYA